VDPNGLSDAEWTDYLFFRNNVRGTQLEYWVHSGGCGQWFVLKRNTLTHEILEVCSLTSIRRVPIERSTPRRKAGKGQAVT
jgi:sarcosine oxidase subunit delta